MSKYTCDQTCDTGNLKKGGFDVRRDELLLTLIIAAHLQIPDGMNESYVKTIRNIAMKKDEYKEAFEFIKLSPDIEKEYVHKYCKIKCDIHEIIGKNLEYTTIVDLAEKALKYMKRIYNTREKIYKQIHSKPLSKPERSSESKLDGDAEDELRFGFDANPDNKCHGTNYFDMKNRNPDIATRFIKGPSECPNDIGCEGKVCQVGCAMDQFSGLFIAKRDKENDINSKFPNLNACSSPDSEANMFSDNIKCLTGAPIYKWLTWGESNNREKCRLVDDFNSPIRNKDGSFKMVPMSIYNRTSQGSIMNAAQMGFNDAMSSFSLDSLSEVPDCKKISVETVYVNPRKIGGGEDVYRCCSERYISVQQIDHYYDKDVNKADEDEDEPNKPEVKPRFTCEDTAAYTKLYSYANSEKKHIKFDYENENPTDSCFCQKLRAVKNQQEYDNFKSGKETMSNRYGSVVSNKKNSIEKYLNGLYLLSIGILLFIIYMRVR